MPNDNITIHALDWTVEEKLNVSGKSEIFCWGLDESSKITLIRILNFPVSRVWKLPPGNWSNRDINTIIETLKIRGIEANRMYYIIRGWLMNKKKLYYYDNKTYPFIHLEFDTEKSMRNCESNLKYPFWVQGRKIQLDPCETQIDSIRKLLTQRNVETSGWFSCDVMKAFPQNKISTIENEYFCINPTSIEPVESDIITYPGILSFDIEAHSFRHNAFPVKWNATDVITTISIVYKKHDVIRKILITQCKCNPIDGVDVVKVDDEIEVIRSFEHHVRLLDPDILTGWNILGFDWDYMNSRLAIEAQKWECMGRIKNRISIFDEKSWSSSAYGNNSFKNLIIDGRITIDMMVQIKRDYKFQSYSLNEVSKILLGKEKLDVSYKEMFEAKDELDAAKTPEEEKEAVKKITRLGEYNVVDSELVLEMFEITSMWIRCVQFSSIFFVAIRDLFRGQQIRVYNQIYDQCTKLGIIVDKPKQTGKGYKGAFVKKPIPGRYVNIIVLDFLSLYPSLMISMNICYSTFVPPDRAALIPEEELYKYNIIEWDENKDDKKPEKGTVHYKFFFAKDPIGVIPLMLQRILSKRSIAKNQMKNEKDPFKKAILNIKQKALKIGANSVYGFQGASAEKGILPLLSAAMSVTAIGRELINDTNNYVEKNYDDAKVVYNDTDSIFIDMKISNHRKCSQIGTKIGLDVTSYLRKEYMNSENGFVGALELEYEKTYNIFFVVVKKTYMAIQRDIETGELKWNKPIYVGGVMVKRDSCKWKVKVYNEVIMAIMQGESRDDIDHIITRAINDIMSHTVDVNTLYTNRGIGIYSAESTYYMKPFIERLRREGNRIRPGDRLNYIVVEDEKQDKVGPKMRLKEEYDKGGMRYDSLYYAINVLQPSIEQIYCVRFEADIKKEIEAICSSQRKQIIQLSDANFKRVSEEGEVLIKKHIGKGDIVKAEKATDRYAVRLTKIKKKRDKDIAKTPIKNMKWGRKLVYSGPGLKPVERGVRIRKAFDAVLEEFLTTDRISKKDWPIKRTLGKTHHFREALTIVIKTNSIITPEEAKRIVARWPENGTVVIIERPENETVVIIESSDKEKRRAKWPTKRTFSKKVTI
uniref:DNA-directed DNA polymerase n=1 Tax=Pithovirus LCPAC403 TaxID=2506596 RepID=A0A481ZCP8_9VIRU|nr:MAG: DNA polymerase elongation subunit family B [Pithovirus LCPAC403]